jgi:hypothetical protein
MEERLASFPSTFRDSRATLTGGGQQAARIASLYPKRDSGDNTALGQRDLNDGKRMDDISFIGGELYNH